MRRLAGACLGVVLLGGCASHGSVRDVQADLKDVHAELSALRQSQETLSRQLADATTSDRAALAAAERARAEVDVASADVARLSSRLDATDAGLRQVKESVATLSAGSTPSATVGTAGTAPVRENRARLAESTYASGMASFRAREYGQAILSFLDVVTKYPGHELAPSAQYWIGESYYLQQDFRQALVEFQRVSSWGPPNPKAADALLKVGLSHSRLREGSRAEEAWQRVVREFPDSAAATQARTLLAQARSSPRR